MYKPFSDHFSMVILATYTTKSAAKDAEREGIRAHSAQGPIGCNTLPAQAGCCILDVQEALTGSYIYKCSKASTMFWVY
jgi:hypothetical protein